MDNCIIVTELFYATSVHRMIGGVGLTGDFVKPAFRAKYMRLLLYLL